ncbi:MAG: SF3a splicing factor complex subunit [Bogoriella megaspora]|nr:MAG: SF3a splicing factor complex subunit [Bogoriella megaspora]
MDEFISSIAEDGKGIIEPPPHFKNTIEKTAGYIVRNGEGFLKRLEATGQAKFDFIKKDNHYYPYFEWRVQEIRAGRGTDIAAGKVGEAAPAQPKKPEGPLKPPDFSFSSRMPPNISAKDLDVLRLVARYTAANGRQWMVKLSQKEAGNPQFDFLRPQHSFHPYFSAMVDQYTDILSDHHDNQRMEELENMLRDRMYLYNRAVQRANYDKYQEKQKQAKEEEAEKERLEFAQIDWPDFNVLQMIDFDEEDEQADLPPAPSLGEIQSKSLEEKAMMSLQPDNMRIEEGIPDEDYSQYAYAQVPPPEFAPYPEAPIQASIPDPAYGAETFAVDEDEEARIHERTQARIRAQQAQAAARAGPDQMRIRSDYVPRAQAKRTNKNMSRCPNCGVMIADDEMGEHIRIELLDDRWKEQRAKFDARNATTNLSTADIANNLKRLASQRSDVFEGQEQGLSEEEQARRKKAALNYDGTMEAKDAAKMQNMNVNEQIRQLHEKYNK